MQYKVTADTTLPNGAPAAEGDVVDLNEGTEEVQAMVTAGTLVEAPAEEETPAAPAEDAAPEEPATPAKEADTVFFGLDVKYRDGTTAEEIENAEQTFVTEFNAELQESRQDHLPLCIESITVKRIA